MALLVALEAVALLSVLNMFFVGEFFEQGLRLGDHSVDFHWDNPAV